MPAGTLAPDTYSPSAQDQALSPDAKERAALPAAPYIASSPERDRGRPALAQLLDAREGGGVAFPEGDARGGSFLWGTRSGRGARAARPQLARPPRARPVLGARPLAPGSGSLPSLALRGAGVAPEFKRTRVVGGKAAACREPSPPRTDQTAREERGLALCRAGRPQPLTLSRSWVGCAWRRCRPAAAARRDGEIGG